MPPFHRHPIAAFQPPPMHLVGGGSFLHSRSLRVIAFDLRNLYNCLHVTMA